MTRYYPILLILTALAVWSCKPGNESRDTGDNGPQVEGHHGLRLENMDTTVSPREDFFHFANGGYIRQYEIPAEESAWGVFQELREGTDAKVRAIMEECMASGAEKGTIEQIIGDYYKAAMDSAAIETAGLSGIQPMLDQVAGMSSKEDLAQVLSTFHQHQISGGFGFWIDQDDKNSNAMVVQLYQGGIGLPDRDYYLDESPRRKSIRESYVEYMKEIHRLAGLSPEEAETMSARIMEMETDMARASMNVVDRRDPDKTYNKMDLDGLKAIAPGLDWAGYFAGLGLEDPGDLVVGQPDFFKNLSKMTQRYPLEDWKVYLRWSLLRSMAPYLSNEFVMADFGFYSQKLGGAEKIRPRWRRVTEDANWSLGMAMGKKFVEKHFSPKAKEMALGMVDNILAEMKERLANLEWMSPETREKAIHKVSTIIPKIGYPDKWRDYSGLQITPHNCVANVLNTRAFNFAYRRSKLGKPVDKTEWGLPPQIVNAFYNPSKNEIVFPAGILQAPFFDEHVDMALNYGGFGAVIGHELIHAFDDAGSKYDAEGNLNNWWTDEDRKNFEARTQLVVDQYDDYVVLDSLRINGRLTLGENIADIDGLRISYHAWKRSQAGKEEAPMKDGFTPEQRFFVNYGQIWSSKMRDAYLEQMIATNPHSPAQYRVIGSTSNLPEFYAAFNVQEGDRMWRPDSLRVVIW